MCAAVVWGSATLSMGARIVWITAAFVYFSFIPTLVAGYLISKLWVPILPRTAFVYFSFVPALAAGYLISKLGVPILPRRTARVTLFLFNFVPVNEIFRPVTQIPAFSL